MRNPVSGKNPRAERGIPGDGKADIDEGHVVGGDIIDVSVCGAELEGLDLIDQDVVRRSGEIEVGSLEFDRSVRTRGIYLPVLVGDEELVVNTETALTSFNSMLILSIAIWAFIAVSELFLTRK